MYFKTMAICLLVAFSSSAIADSITYEVDILTTDIGNGSTVNLPQFDPSDPALGPTLISIVLQLDATALNGTIIWDNESEALTDVTLGIGATVTATGPDSFALVAIPLQTGQAYDVPADNDGYPPDYAGDDSFAVSTGTGSDSDSDNPTDFTPYIGTGTFSVNIASSVKTNTETDGGDGMTQTTAGDYYGKVKVTYTYVPEPATLSLLGAGAVLLYRRKR